MGLQERTAAAEGTVINKKWWGLGSQKGSEVAESEERGKISGKRFQRRVGLESVV